MQSDEVADASARDSGGPADRSRLPRGAASGAEFNEEGWSNRGVSKEGYACGRSARIRIAIRRAEHTKVVYQAAKAFRRMAAPCPFPLSRHGLSAARRKRGRAGEMDDFRAGSPSWAPVP